MLNPFTRDKARQQLGQFVGTVWRYQRSAAPSEHLSSGVPVVRFGGAIPRLDRSIEPHSDDRVIGGLDDRATQLDHQLVCVVARPCRPSIPDRTHPRPQFAPSATYSSSLTTKSG